MLSIDLKRLLAAVAVMAGLLAVAAPAGSHAADRTGSSGLKADSNEVAIEGFWLGSNDALGIASRARDVDVWETVR